MIEGLHLLEPWLPDGGVALAQKWLDAPNLTVKLVARNGYRLGTYTLRPNGRQSIILNTCQDRYSFLVTLAHEVAHMQATHRWGRKIAPHGPEWQSICRGLLTEAALLPALPDDIREAILFVAQAPKSTHLSHREAGRIFMKYNEKYKEMILLADVPHGEKFALDDGRVFVKEEKNRTRFKCRLVGTSRRYLIGGTIPVKRVA